MNVFKMSKTRNVLSKVMMLLVVLVTTVLCIRVNAETIEYPFRKGEEAFLNAPTWQGASEKASGDTWQYLESNIDTPMDFTNVTAVAIEIKMVSGNPGLMFGIRNYGDRYGTYGGGNPFYLVTEDGQVTEITNMYDSINLGDGFKGMLVLPMSSMSWVGWASANKSLSIIQGVFIETNAVYNWNFALQIGEIGYYVGDFQNGGEFTKIKDLSEDLKETSYYNGLGTKTPLTFPELVKPQKAYPFENELQNSPIWYGDSAGAAADTWQFLESMFTATDLSSAYAIAVEIKAVQGNPGFTFGIENGGNRYGTYVDGQKLYLVSKDGSVKEISVLYGSINLGDGFEGMLVAPISSMAWVGWAGATKTLASIDKIFIETNAVYNWNFALQIGEIGYYNADFQNGGIFTKVKDLTTDEHKGTYYNARPNENPLVFPSDLAAPKDPYEGQTIEYPFRKGNNAYQNAVLWNGISHTPNGDNWQTLFINFPETDLSSASFIAVQYVAKAGAPGITYGLQHKGARYGLSGVADGQKIYMANEAGLVEIVATTQYSASNVSKNGMLLIPMTAMGWQWGSDAEKDLTKIHQLLLTTNSLYNYNYEILIGEVGYYTGTMGTNDFEFHKLIDLTSGDKFSSFACVSDNPDYNGRISINKIDQKVYGDTNLEVFGTNKQGSDYVIWDGGSFGEVTMGKDSYGDDAIVMKSTGPNPTGDAYTAITLADGIAYDWSDAKGVTLWARNDSETEISFNIQLDCLVDVDGDGTRDRGRFNVRQGFQFWLYDLNTGKDTIYMTRPEITLPVGFEGWIRVPFEAFLQADWSLVDPNHKVIPRNYFMAEGSVVGYLAITIDSRAYAGQTFAVNKIGSYKTTPVLTTAIIKDDSKSIRKLMGLE